MINNNFNIAMKNRYYNNMSSFRLQQQYYQHQYEQPQFQQYHYFPLQQVLQVPLTIVDVPSEQSNGVCDMLININMNFEGGIHIS